MSVITKQKLFARLGINSTDTDRKGSPSTWKYVPVALSGVDLGGSVASEELELQRKDVGITHVLGLGRNTDKGKIECPVYPELAGTLLGLAMNDNANGHPKFFTLEEYWASTLGASWDAGNDTGRLLAGCVADGFSFGFDRKQLGSLKLSLDAYCNRDAEIESAAPTPTWPAQDPIIGKNVLVDLDLGDNSNAFGGWSGDALDLRSFNIAVQRQLELDLQRADESDVNLDGTWTQVYPGTTRAALTFKTILNSAKYLDLHRLAGGLRYARLRCAWYGSAPSGNTTSTATLSAGSSVVVTVASTTGFAVGDVVLLWQPTANKFAVGIITALSVGVSITIDTLDLAMNGGTETIKVRNTAGQVKVPSARIKTQGRPKLEGNVYVVDFTADAVLSPSTTSPVQLTAYDDDNT